MEFKLKFEGSETQMDRILEILSNSIISSIIKNFIIFDYCVY